MASNVIRFPRYPLAEDDDTPIARRDIPLHEIPVEKQSDTEFLRTVKKWWNEAFDHWSDWRREAEMDFRFEATDQWSEDDRRKLLDEKRPAVTFNRIHASVASVVGLEIGNRREVRFIPREQGDVKANEILTSGAEWVRDQTDAEDEETDAFHDCVVCGMGWVDHRMDYEDDPQGMLKIERIDPFEMLPDPQARRRNITDMKYCFRARTMSLDEAMELVPGHPPEMYDASWARGNTADKIKHIENSPSDHYLRLNPGDEDLTGPDGMVTLVHLKYWVRESYFRVADMQGNTVVELSKEEGDKLKGRWAELREADPSLPDLPMAELTRRVYKQAWIGRDVLERLDNDCADAFGWECITGHRDQIKGHWFGIVRLMRDPQMWANKWLSQGMHILNSNAKGGLLFESDVFVNPKQAEKDWAHPDRNIEVRPGALSGPQPAIQPRVPPPFPTELAQMLQFALLSIRDAAGVNLEMLGMVDRTQPGIVEENRKQSSMVILQVLFDSLRRFRKRQGDILLYFIQNFLADGRLIRVTGEEGAQYMEFLLNTDVEYDVVVDDAANSPNQKEKTWLVLQQLLPVIGQMLGPEDMLILAEYSPLPASIVEKLRQASDKRAEETQGMQAEQMRLTLEKAQADIEKTHADAQRINVDFGKLQLDKQRLDMEAALKGVQLQGEQQAQAIEGQKAATEQQATGLEALQAQQMHRLEMEKMERQHALEIERMHLDNNIKREQGVRDAHFKRAELRNNTNTERQAQGLPPLHDVDVETGQDQPNPTDVALQALAQGLQQLAQGQQQMSQALLAPKQAVKTAEGRWVMQAGRPVASRPAPLPPQPA